MHKSRWAPAHELNWLINMKTIRMAAFCLPVIIGLLNSCGNYKQQQSRNAMKDLPLKVIFETDMGNDIDDALALDMLYKYADQGKIELLGISTNKNSPYSVQFLDLMNTWYGYPRIPLGNVIRGADSEGDAKNYTQAVSEHAVDGKPVFKRSVENYAKVPGSVEMYRKILSGQPDSSVTIISVGFSTNLERLLASPPDKYSTLNGQELVARKVKLLSMMAGNFRKEKQVEYNVVKDPAAAREVFASWPGKIIVSPFEVGEQVLYPASSIENDFPAESPHPLVLAYESYLEMPYDRPTWDLTSVLYVVEGSEGYFDLSPPGTVSVDENSFTHFREDPDGKHRYLLMNSQQAVAVKGRFIELIKPGNTKK